jgi:hypothetical protein
VNEKDLFEAYRNMARIKSDPRSEKCVVKGCPTQIDVSAQRVMCWYHTGKIQRGEK